MELPNIPGCSRSFDEIEPAISAGTREVHTEACRARTVGVADVLSAATQMIKADPWALMPRSDVQDSRAGDGVKQRLARLENGTNESYGERSSCVQ